MLDLRGNRVKIVPPLVNNRHTIVIPEISKMTFNLKPQLMTDIEITSMWLVLDIFNQLKPTIKCVLYIIKATSSTHTQDNIDEVIHEYREKCYAKNLNQRSHPHLRYWYRVIVAIPNCSKCGQGEVHAYNKLLMNFFIQKLYVVTRHVPIFTFK